MQAISAARVRRGDETDRQSSPLYDAFGERCPRGNRRISLLSRLDGPRGVAGKLGTMAATGEKQGNTTKKKQKPTGKKQKPSDKKQKPSGKKEKPSGRSNTNPGRKPSGSNKPGKGHAARPCMGAARLRSSINSLVEKESEELAMALVDHAKAGNVSSAKLLVEFSGANDPPPAPKKKQRSLSLSEYWGGQPQWQGQADEDEGSGCGGREPEL